MVKNIVEEVVAREYERLKRSLKDVPESDTFRDDVLAYTLNRLRPRYVARPTGQVMTNISMDSDQELARVSVILLEAIQIARSAPQELRKESQL